MNPSSELTLRNVEGIGSRPLLLINPPRDSLAHELLREGAAEVNVFTQDFGDHRFFLASSMASQFGLLPEPQAVTRSVILFLPREKDRLEFLLHFISAHLPSPETLWLVGENKGGIKSADTRLKQRFAKVQKVDSARHCVLYQAAQAIGANVGASHARDQESRAFDLDAYRKDWTLKTPSGEIKLQSLPGSFAHGRLDKGTALLLDYLQNADKKQLKIKGKMLDFGCGAGVIGLYLKQQNPNITLEMLDSSAAALESTRAALLLNDCEAQVIAADGLDAVKDRFDLIISNPPFHKGVATDLDTAQRFIARAPTLLGNRGKLLLVCNRHLPYESWLAESFAGMEKGTENREFKVLLAFGPRSAADRAGHRRRT
ncbi:MAG: methyltransferase [Xanthomonadales bacterium]|nr:methyltransferase [Xanthomonadales bacterium]